MGCWESRKGIVSEVSRVEMKRRGRIKIEVAKTICFCLTQKQKQNKKIKPVQNILY